MTVHALAQDLNVNPYNVNDNNDNVNLNSSSDMSDCNVAMNNALRKIFFGFKQWQSIRYLRELFCFESLYIIFKKAQDKFLALCRSHTNLIVQFVSTL